MYCMEFVEHVPSHYNGELRQTLEPVLDYVYLRSARFNRMTWHRIPEVFNMSKSVGETFVYAEICPSGVTSVFWTWSKRQDMK